MKRKAMAWLYFDQSDDIQTHGTGPDWLLHETERLSANQITCQTWPESTWWHHEQVQPLDQSDDRERFLFNLNSWSIIAPRGSKPGRPF